MAAFYYGLKCLHAASQKRALTHAISLAVDYRLFSHGDVSYRFNGKNDNVVLESKIIHRKQNQFDSNMIKTGKLTLWRRSTVDSFSADVNIYM